MPRGPCDRQHARGAHARPLRRGQPGVHRRAGPSVIYIVSRSLAEGRRAGIVSALGIQTGGLVHVLAATIGVSALLASSAVAFSVVKYAGAPSLFSLGPRKLLAGEPPELRTGAPVGRR